VTKPPITVSNAVSIHQLNHAYNRNASPRTVVDDLSLNVEFGETVAIVGRSGSGKSTLLNIIGGLEPVQQGNVHVLGNSLSELSDSQRTALRRVHIGFIYQAFNLIPTLNVADNISLPLALSGTTANKRNELLHPLLSSVGLEGRGDDYPDVLSGGEQQRVAIARALIHKPAVVLADEPTGNLDAQSGRQILLLLEDLVSEQNSSLLLVTHSLEVARVADRALIMAAGKLKPAQASHINGSLAW